MNFISALMEKIYNHDLQGLIEISEKIESIDFCEPELELTPLIYAVGLEWVEGVNALLDLGADPNFSLPESNALVSAIESKNLEIRKILLAARADPDAKGCLESPLALAILDQDIQLIKSLINVGANVNRQNSEGSTPLMIAVLQGNIDVVDILLEHGANTDIVSRDGEIALSFAARKGYKEIFDRLYALTGDSEQKKEAEEQRTRVSILDSRRNDVELAEFMDTVLNQNIKLIKSKIDSGIDINTFDENGETALYKSIIQENFSITRILLSLGANPNIGHEEFDYTPLKLSIHNNYLKVISLLLESGVDPNSPIDSHGITPLMVAVDCNRLEIVELLLQSGANINARDINGRNALFYAAQNGNLEMVEYLKKMGATGDYSSFPENLQYDEF